jgi:hypothetical protein
MSSAMEKMVANMLGVTPEQMQEMLTGFQNLLANLGGKLDTIIAKEDENKALLLSIIERMESNVGSKRKPASRGSDSFPGTSADGSPTVERNTDGDS